MATSRINIAPVVHLDPVFLADMTSGRTDWDSLNFREAFEATAAERAALSRVLDANVDLPNAVHIVRQSMPKVLQFLPEIEKLPVRVDLIKRADLYARSTIHAHVLYSASVVPPERLQAVYEETLGYRARARSEIAYLVNQGVLPPEALDGIGMATGYRNVAYDTQMAVTRLRFYKGAIAGRAVLDAETLNEFEANANELEDLFTRRETNRSGDPKLAEERDRSFTLMHDSFEWARCAIHCVRWFYGDAKEIAPSLFSTVEAKEAKARADRAKAARANASGDDETGDADTLDAAESADDVAVRGLTERNADVSSEALNARAKAGMRGSDPFGQ